MVITGMRGAGKTFWWSALQERSVRQMVAVAAPGLSTLDANTEVRRGFGVDPATDDYPGRDELRLLMAQGVDPRMIWRTVQARQVADAGDPLRQDGNWHVRVQYASDNPGRIDRLFQKCDEELQRRGVYFLILFDALDLCPDDWQEMYRAIRGLLQTALDMRPYRRLRVKVFLRTDQVNEAAIANFPDASKVLSSRVELAWPRHELYGLLWHLLVNGTDGEFFQQLLGDVTWQSESAGARLLFPVPRRLVTEAAQRHYFHQIAGEWMGKGPRRGLPYTWIPNHLGDAGGKVSPRSFLAALRTAAEDTGDRHADHNFALHYDSIKKGVQEASRIRVNEIQEDYPWVGAVLSPLRGKVVPCPFEQIEECWAQADAGPKSRTGCREWWSQDAASEHQTGK